jgi:hypothetical protein
METAVCPASQSQARASCQSPNNTYSRPPTSATFLIGFGYRRRLKRGVSWLEIGVSQMSGNKLMVLKPRLPIETDYRATVVVPQEVLFYDTSNIS